MDWQIRIALAIVGLVLVGYIFYDFSKKKKRQKENQKLKHQFSSSENQVDSTGFDFNGVGAARPVTEIDTGAQKTLTGQPVETFLTENAEDNPQPTTNSVIGTSAAESKDLFQAEAKDADLQSEPELVFSLILQANDGQIFKGKDFLPILLSQGLRHGDMGIFHRHKNAGANPGPVMFSLANGISPGTFNLTNLEMFETPAFALFMTLPGAGDAQVAYDSMVKTIKLLKSELGGEILDERKVIYSEQIHNHRLDAIKEYVRKL